LWRARLMRSRPAAHRFTERVRRHVHKCVVDAPKAEPSD
jgi:hypothetical protein